MFFMRVEFSKYIIADSEICHGRPTFRGTRILVHVVLEMLEAGASVQEIIRAYPSLTKAHIKAALDFAAKLTKRSVNERRAELVSA